MTMESESSFCAAWASIRLNLYAFLRRGARLRKPALTVAPGRFLFVVKVSIGRQVVIVDHFHQRAVGKFDIFALFLAG
jgi:hypothetical protein